MPPGGCFGTILGTFYNGTQWGKFLGGRILKIQKHRILDVCLVNISTKFGQSRSRIKKIKTSQCFTYRTYINTIISHIVAPPRVKLHVEISPAVIHDISTSQLINITLFISIYFQPQLIKGEIYCLKAKLAFIPSRVSGREYGIGPVCVSVCQRSHG